MLDPDSAYQGPLVTPERQLDITYPLPEEGNTSHRVDLGAGRMTMMDPHPTSNLKETARERIMLADSSGIISTIQTQGSFTGRTAWFLQ